MYLLQNVVKVGGRLLWVQCDKKSQSDGDDLVSALLCTFDVGRIVIFANSKAGCIEQEPMDSEASASSRLVSLNETEPWWRVIGSPLVRADQLEGTEEFRLQFRADDRNPRYIHLKLEQNSIRFFMETPPDLPSAGLADPKD